MRNTQGVLPRLFTIFVLCLGAFVQCNRLQGASNTWTRAGNLAEPRQGSAAVLLKDGRVLVTGGAGSAVLASTELFNTDGSFSMGPPMLQARTHHTAILLQDGRVLVAGGTGTDGLPARTAEIYDPATNAWTPVRSDMTEARADHTSSLLNDGRVLIAGGQTTSGATNTLEIFSPGTNSFTPVSTGVLSAAREQHAAAVLSDGSVFMAGGSDGAHPLSTADVFNPVSGTVSQAGAMSTPRVRLSATTLLDGKVLLAGGSNGSADLTSAEIYDPAATSFAPTGNLSVGRSGHSAFLLPNNNEVLIAGGSSSGSAVSATELFVPWNGSFTQAGVLSAPRVFAAGTALNQDGQLLVAGGTDGRNALASAEIFNFATIKTDAADYPPGTTVNISGSGWQPGELVSLTLLESPLFDTHGPYTAVADSNGNIFNGEFATDEFDLNIHFNLTAKGSVSQAQNSFTDGPSIDTTTTFTATPSSSTYGQTITFSVNVTYLLNQVQTSVSGGCVTLKDGNTILSGPIQLNSGTASFQISTLTVGSHTLQADYNEQNGKCGSTNVGYANSHGNASVSVNKAVLTVTAKDAFMTYGGPLPTFSATYSGFINGDTQSVVTGTPSFTPTTAPRAAGSYDIIPAQNTLTAANYTFTFAKGTLTVNQAVLTITAKDASMTYGGPLPAFSATYSGFVNGDAQSVVTGTPSFTPTTAPSTTGTVAITPAQGTLAATNYTFKFVPGTLTVNKASLVVSPTDATRQYGDPNPTFTGTITGVVNGDNISANYTTNAVQASPVGTYSITAALNDPGNKLGNYNVTTNAGKLTITSRGLTLTADSQQKVYGTTDPALTYKVTTGSLLNGDTFTGALTRDGGEDVGSYAIKQGNLAAGSNYTITFVGASLTISKAPLTVTPTDATRQYGDANPTFTGTITGVVNSDNITANYTTTAVQASPVGTYDITATLNDPGNRLTNYNVTLNKGKLTVTTRALTITADAQQKVYGAADPALTYKITSGSLVGNDAFTGTLTRDAGENVGTYAIKQGALALNTNYNLAFVGANLTISPAPLTVTPADATRQYGDANPTFTGTLTGVVNGDNIAASYSTAATLTSAVGSYVITAMLNDPDHKLGNYTVTLKEGTLSITTRALTVTADAQQKVYGTTDPALTYKVSGGSLVNGDAFSGALIRDAGENVGTYAIKQGTLALSANYSLTCVPGTLRIDPAPLTITPADATRQYGDANPAFTGTLTGVVNGDTITASYATPAVITSAVGNYPITATLNDPGNRLGNYTVTKNSGTLTITARALTVTADAKQKVYGATDPILTYQVTGGSLVNGDTFSGALTRDAGENVGTYAIKQGSLSLSANYNLTYVPAGLKIDSAPLTVTPADATRQYGDPNPAFTGTITGVVKNDNITASYTTTAVVTSAVGNYSITATLNDPDHKLGNYTVTIKEGKLCITARALTVTADAQQKVYGTTDPALTYKVTGGSLANGDAFSGALTRDAGENVGTYAIKQGTLALTANYTVTYVPASLKIDPAPLTVTPADATRQYGEPNPVFIGTITGVVHNDDITVNYSTIAVQASAVGSYEITATLVDPGNKLGNYIVTLNKGNLIITTRAIAVVADSQHKVYGSTDPALTYKVISGSLVNGDAFSGALTRDAGTNVGTYPIRQGTLALTTNYALTFQEADLTISPAPLTVTPADATRQYGDPNPVFTGTITGVVNNDNISATYATTAVVTSPIGPYTITATLNDTDHKLGNYTVTQSTGTLTITARTVTVTATAQEKIYGSGDRILGYEVSGGSLANNDAFAGALTRDAGEDVGTYAIKQGNLTLGTNYTITFVGASLTINKAPLAVSPANATRQYGDANPTLSGEITGIVNGDNITASYSTTATVTSAVGSYPISASLNDSGSKLTNYNVTLNTGNLTVTARALTVTADAQQKVYGNNDPALTYKVTSGSMANGDSFSGALTREAGETVGSYAITQGTLALTTNYSIHFVGTSLTISKASLTVTPADATRQYGDPNPTLAGSITGVVNGDNITANYATPAVVTSAVGSYLITATLNDVGNKLGNYTVTLNAGNLTVTVRPITVMADAQQKLYGSADPTPWGYKITSGSLVNDDKFSGALTRDAGENVGTYAIKQGTLTLSSNYALTFVGASLTINKATLTITPDGNKTKLLGSTFTAFTGTVTGRQFKDDVNVTYISSGAPASAGVGTYDITVADVTFTTGVATNYNIVKNTAIKGLAVLYNSCPLYDPTRAVKSGATYPIKLYLCDVNGADVSSPSIVLNATSVNLTSGWSGPVEDAGNANPDANFRYDATLGPSGGYIFNLKTTGLVGGSYNLTYTAGGTGTRSYGAGFGVK